MKIARIANKKDMFKLADSNGEEEWFHLKEGKVRDFAIKKYKIGDELGELGKEIKITGDKKNDKTITFIGSDSSSGEFKDKSETTKSYSKGNYSKGNSVQKSIEKQTLIKATPEVIKGIDGVTEANVVGVLKDVYNALKSVSDADEMKVAN